MPNKLEEDGHIRETWWDCEGSGGRGINKNTLFSRNFQWYSQLLHLDPCLNGTSKHTRALIFLRDWL